MARRIRAATPAGSCPDCLSLGGLLRLAVILPGLL